MTGISVVVPIFNEAETIPELYSRLKKALDPLGGTYELVFVDDGSRDASAPNIRALAAGDKAVKLVQLSRNFGLQVAYSAGIDHASGEAVIVMDGDLQDPPELLPVLVSKWKEGYDVVYTVKTKRKENFLKRFAFAAFYRLLNRISTVEMPLDAGSFSLMSRRVADIFKSLPEKNRLVSGIRAWVGFSQAAVRFERDARFSGEPRQTFLRLMRMATDGLFSFSAVPVRVASVLGLAVSAFAVLVAVAVSLIRVFTDLLNTVPGWTSLLVAVVFFGGLQLLFIGILGEYVCRIFDEVKDRPLYLVRDKVGFDKDP